jgi:hypothetical protein
VISGSGDEGVGRRKILSDDEIAVSRKMIAQVNDFVNGTGRIVMARFG